MHYLLIHGIVSHTPLTMQISKDSETDKAYFFEYGILILQIRCLIVLKKLGLPRCIHS